MDFEVEMLQNELNGTMYSKSSLDHLLILSEMDLSYKSPPLSSHSDIQKVRNFISDNTRGIKSFMVYYKINPRFEAPDVVDLAEYQFLTTVSAFDEEEVFGIMQAHVWSPNGMMNPFIAGLGLHHTSMSVGDIVLDLTDKVYRIVDSIGFKEISVSGCANY
jgi:hypothetical protein